MRGGLFVHPGLDVVVGGAIWYPFWVLFQFFVRAPALAVLAYAVPFLVSRQRESMRVVSRAKCATARRWLMGATLLLIVAAGAPTRYIGGGVPPDRAQIVPVFAVVLVLMSSGFLDGLGSRTSSPRRPNTWRRAALVCGFWGAIALGPMLVTLRILAPADELKAYAATLDDMDLQARRAQAAGEPELHVQLVRQPALIGLDELGPDATVWPNTCVAAYYGLPRIVAVGPGLSS